MSRIRACLRSRKGATIVEYAMLILFVGLAVAAVMGLVGVDLNAAYERIREPFLNR